MPCLLTSCLFPLQYSFGIHWNLLLGSTKSSLLLQYSEVLLFSLHNRQLVGFKMVSRLPHTAIRYNWYPRFLESSEVVTDGLCNCSSGSVNCVNQIFCVYLLLSCYIVSELLSILCSYHKKISHSCFHHDNMSLLVIKDDIGIELSCLGFCYFK